MRPSRTPREQNAALSIVAVYPEVGIASDVDHLLGSVLTYNLPVVCRSPEALARLAILGE